MIKHTEKLLMQGIFGSSPIKDITYIYARREMTTLSIAEKWEHN